MEGARVEWLAIFKEFPKVTLVRQPDSIVEVAEGVIDDLLFGVIKGLSQEGLNLVNDGLEFIDRFLGSDGSKRIAVRDERHASNRSDSAVGCAFSEIFLGSVQMQNVKRAHNCARRGMRFLSYCEGDGKHGRGKSH